MANLFVIGWILNIIGVGIITSVSIINPRHQRIHNEDKLWKRYWWQGWRPIFKVYPSNEKERWMIRPKNKVVRYGFIPPTQQWNIVGFLYILSGLLLHLFDYLNHIQ